MADLPPRLETTVQYSTMGAEEGRLQWWKGISTSNTVTSCIGRRLQLCSILSVTIALFLILVIVMPLKFSQQDKMLKELETKADNMALSLNSLPNKLQQKAPLSQGPEHKALTEVKSALTNLQASITSLSSEQHKTADQQNRRLTELGHTVTDLSQSVKASSSNSLPSSVNNSDEKDTKITKLDHDIVDLSHSVNALSTDFHETVKHRESALNELKTKADNIHSSLDSIPSKLQETVEKAGRKMEHSVTNLTLSMNALSSGLQDTVSQQDTKMQKLETAMNSMSSSLESVASKMQQTDEKLTSMLNALSAEIMSIKRSKDNPTYRCQNNWSLNASSCYLFSSNKLTWHEAGDYCRTQGASLLILNNAKEWDFITQITVSEFYWVGLTDEITGKWAWVDGTPYVMDQSQWKVGQPDNWTKHGLGGGEDCAELAEMGKLNDDHCSRQRKYICERAATAD